MVRVHQTKLVHFRFSLPFVEGVLDSIHLNHSLSYFIRLRIIHQNQYSGSWMFVSSGLNLFLQYQERVSLKLDTQPAVPISQCLLFTL